MENNKQEDSILVDGLYFKKKHDAAPDFVKGSVSMKVDELIPFLQKHKKADGWVNTDLLVSKAGKLYFKLNTFQPKTQDTTTPPAEVNGTAITPEDIPFN